MQVVEQGTPFGVKVEASMGETEDFAVTVGDNREMAVAGMAVAGMAVAGMAVAGMAVAGMAEVFGPDGSAVLEHISVEIGI